MAQKYAAFDQKLLGWLAANQKDVTTSQVNQALQADTTTLQRHVSRRFSQLEDRGVLVCRLEGTTRICQVVLPLPDNFNKKTPIRIIEPPLPAVSIPAENSSEFEAAGGKIQRLPSTWDRRPTCNAVGLISIDHILAALD